MSYCRTIHMTLPRPVTAIHQIELTSRCNLRCRYCIHPTMSRTKGDMSLAHFRRALDLARHFVLRGTQYELNLAGVGESTLHPNFVDMVRLARQRLPDTRLVMATNGVGYDGELVEAVAPYNLRVWVSLHRPEKAGNAVRWWSEAGLLEGVSTDPVTLANDWAGQVSWHNTGAGIPCHWIRNGRAFVRSTGVISTCCIEGSDDGAIGHLDDDDLDVEQLQLAPYSLCKGCYQDINIAGHDQRRGLPIVKE